ncbi:hypothetical protein RO3G_03838 [Rhizopus delemar RA 99-880]|uniref:Uncharacterized protein n=1 Tax=Rhizopus delemar (strain RA 99-880 / ATCC MYA-4621 / FGSC 9543 / NRRL 43880) TaxID=246409 RepID=I1BSF3_RHIO9|nr:hypothetical protein RO3G_03838 [Rhizopus delemar RA 99-880]|eukprot:EIE79133.1 hypothetical protein RO3G_03838 [Rhizopus delemar RA 99-880]
MSETTDNVENHQLFASLRTQKMQLCQSPKVVNFQRASSEAMNFCKYVIDHIRPTFNPVDLIDVIVKKCCLHFKNDNYAIQANSESSFIDKHFHFLEKFC